MAETRFTIGADASCTDGGCGEVSRVVVDPVARVVTHLVVQPKDPRALARLVPLDLVDITPGEVHLQCTLAEFDKLDHAEETQFVQPRIGLSGYGAEQMLSWPYYFLDSGMAIGRGVAMGVGDLPEPVTHDTLPLGKVAVRRGEHVHATDGDIGRVQGLVITQDRHVTHVLLQEGHLWGRKQVAIPIAAVISVGDGIHLNLTKRAVQDLPPVNVGDPNG
jgi:sporulation protein YlmC with PRC-barrel domain